MRLQSRSHRVPACEGRRQADIHELPHTITRGFASVDERNTAICLLPGTELAFEKEVRCETGVILSWGLGHKVAKFRQVNQGQATVHHDALEFPDGKTVLLTQLCKGQRATVLQLPAGIGVTVDDAQSKNSTVASRSQKVWSQAPANTAGPLHAHLICTPRRGL